MKKKSCSVISLSMDWAVTVASLTLKGEWMISFQMDWIFIFLWFDWSLKQKKGGEFPPLFHQFDFTSIR